MHIVTDNYDATHSLPDNFGKLRIGDTVTQTVYEITNYIIDGRNFREWLFSDPWNERNFTRLEASTEYIGSSRYIDLNPYLSYVTLNSFLRCYSDSTINYSRIKCDTVYRTSVKELSKIENEPSIYPNPAHDLLTLQLPQGANYNNATLFDILGQKVLDVPMIPNSETTQISLIGLPVGMYYLSLTGPGQIHKHIPFIHE